MKTLAGVLLLTLGLSALACGQSVMLAWDAPTSYTDGSPLPAPPEHTIYIGVTSGTYTTDLPVGQATSILISGLVAGQTYCFVATASLEGQESGYSNEVCASIAGGDTMPPSVAITFPQDGAIVVRRSLVTILASASDDVAVAKVEFYLDGNLRCLAAILPYICPWTVPAKRNRRYAWWAIASDASGNARTSALVHVTSQ
jgi:chitinase